MIEEVLLPAIASVGFPIVAFFLMYQMCKDTITKNTDALAELKEAFKELKGKI